MKIVEAQYPGVTGTTANVTISGYLDTINVHCIPVSFSETKPVFSDSGSYEKDAECGNNTITIDPADNTNEYWNLYMNATDLTDGEGHWINISYYLNHPDYGAILQVNTTCGDNSGGMGSPTGYITLGYELKPICGLAGNRFGPIQNPAIEFNITIPSGTYNATYTGDFCIFINKTGVDAVNNQTWCGITTVGSDQMNVTISKTREIAWTLNPITFGESQSPSLEYYNASDWLGFPTNITSGLKTNIFVDLYINGTDLVKLGVHDPLFINVITSHNVTYSNSTDPTRTRITNKEPVVWPPADTKELEHNLPDVSTHGDFTTWTMIENNTHVYGYWNMTVPVLSPLTIAPGTYVANITAKITDVGEDPTP